MKASQKALLIFLACYIAGSILVIIEASMEVISIEHHYTKAILLVVGDGLFFLGPTILCIGAFIDLRGIEGLKMSTLGWRHLELGTFVVFGIAGGVFTVGSALYLAYKIDPALILWMIGSGLFIIAAFLKLLVDQQILSHLYKKDFTHGEEKTPQFIRKERMLWLNVIGQNFNFASAVVITVGSALFFGKTRGFNIAGSICWIVALGLLIVGTLFKLSYALEEIMVLRDNAKENRKSDIAEANVSPHAGLLPARRK